MEVGGGDEAERLCDKLFNLCFPSSRVSPPAPVNGQSVVGAPYLLPRPLAIQSGKQDEIKVAQRGCHLPGTPS
ncbi:hypothetical protein CPAR01_13816 [Colletotrichum paranaense]|uniref:Uncharacterized protein n=1 Tax=Colletotrichum paranaense TaxID=1914294 RepID=A0ABQ9S4G7_9PEZI|nr:uncharacterized protein CPAR01_13816 [Colletotrichum paranaense]KAK1524868.1 hypothetical protein CPAR01_13816 [Colletotrichum paranaense]